MVKGEAETWEEAWATASEKKPSEEELAAQKKRDEAAELREARGPMAERILGFIVVAFPSLIGMFLSRGMDAAIAAITSS